MTRPGLLVRRWWPAGLLVAAILLFFHKLVFSGLILARGDTFLYFYPYWQAAANALFVAGRLPRWNPDLFMGAPFLANSQVGLLYPLNWPAWALLATPYAVSASIVLHLAIAGAGTYLLARRVLRLSRPGALLAALLFALGGYLTAQVEHVNQLQGLAWLPWLLLVAGDGAWLGGAWRGVVRRGLGLALLLALQFMAGHTQTLFISGAGLAIWLLVGIQMGRRSVLLSDVMRTACHAHNAFSISHYALRLLLFLALGGGLTLLLVLPQLLPTLTLAGQSSRAGGLPPNEVLSFSLHPLLLARALLPAYGQTLFTEYVAMLPLTALLLAGVGVARGRTRPGVWPAILLAALGLFLALGQFNPLYQLLARLPGFDLFRVPARWLALYGLGVALLAGVGWELVVGGRPADWSRPVRLATALLLGLMAWGALAVPLARVIPLGAESAAEWPSRGTLIGWLLELGLALGLLLARPGGRPARWRGAALAGLGLVALLAASRSLPYNHPTAPEAYFDLRPPIARLQARQDCGFFPQECGPPPGRVLSLSPILFDLGDQAEMDSIYADQLSPGARFDLTVATKHKEVLSPNLPLAYGLAAVDGFDGGILPLRDYTTLMQLILPEGVTTTDGRLREFLPAVPEARWLDLFNARYLITDKVGDEWHEGVFFDRQHPVTLRPGETASVGYVPDYEATALWLLAAGEPGRVLVTDPAGQTWTLTPQPLAERLWQVTLPRPLAPAGIRLQAGDGEWLVEGLALVDARDGSFQSLVPGQYRLLLSGDVKLYENLDVLPRAFLVYGWSWRPDVAGSVAAMSAPLFDPRTEVVLVGEGERVCDCAGEVGAEPGRVTILSYAAERVVLRSESDRDGLLLLTDAFYPGWQVAIDGVPATAYQADGLFRGVFVPAGEHEVVWTFAGWR